MTIDADIVVGLLWPLPDGSIKPETVTIDADLVVLPLWETSPGCENIYNLANAEEEDDGGGGEGGSVGTSDPKPPPVLEPFEAPTPPSIIPPARRYAYTFRLR